MSKRRIIRFLCWSDRLSRSCWRNWTQAPFHVCLWTAYWAPWPSMAVPAFCCWTIWNDCLQGQQKLLFYSSLWFFFFSHSSCGFSRFPAEKLIKQKLAFGPTGTEKLNRFLYSSHTTWFYKLRNMWFNLLLSHRHSSSYNSTSRWRSLFLRWEVLHHLQVWSDPLPWWVLLMDTQEVTCLLHRQEACPSILSHLVPPVPPICRLICHPCPWGHLLLMVYDPLIVPWPVDLDGIFFLCAEKHNFWEIFIHLFSLWMSRTPQLVTLFCMFCSV